MQIRGANVADAGCPAGHTGASDCVM